MKHQEDLIGIVSNSKSNNSGSYISDWKDIVDHHDFKKSLMTMCMDFATPDTNMSPCQDIEQCIEGEEDKGDTKYKWLFIQEDKRLKKHQPKRTIMHPNQHFEGRKK